MPERLSAAGVSWKVYNDPTTLLELSPFPYFKTFWEPSNAGEAAMASQALTPTYPVSFVADVAADNLPAVSWIMPPLAECEHPAAPPEYGEYLVQEILNTLVSNPDVWSRRPCCSSPMTRTAGFFDHVPPPAPPPGTERRVADGRARCRRPPRGSQARSVWASASRAWLSRRSAVVGTCASETFDHTSTLRFLETRFGVEVPNLSSWRRGVTADLTGALALANAPDTTVPPLPPTSLGDTTVAQQAVINALAGTEDLGVPYPPPTENVMPSQEGSPRRPPVPR